MQITNNNINKEEQQQNKSYSLTPKMYANRFPLISSSPQTKALTPLTSVAQLNMIAPLLYAHSQTSFLTGAISIFVSQSYFIDELRAHANHGEYNCTTDM